MIIIPTCPNCDLSVHYCVHCKAEYRGEQIHQCGGDSECCLQCWQSPCKCMVPLHPQFVSGYRFLDGKCHPGRNGFAQMKIFYTEDEVNAWVKEQRDVYQGRSMQFYLFKLSALGTEVIPIPKPEFKWNTNV